MKIGYWGYGHLLPNRIAADGCYHIRDSLIKQFKKDGHEIIWLGSLRDRPTIEEKNKYLDSPYNKVELGPWNSDFNEKNKLYKKDTNKWYFDHVFQKRELPDVDMVFVEINLMGLKKYDIVSVLEHYTNKNVKCFLWDMDSWGTGLNCYCKREIFNINQDNIYFLTPYEIRKFEQQITFYYGYDRDKQLPMKEKNNMFSYVGNDYKRGKKLIHFYKDLEANIYGNFLKDKENIIPIIGSHKFKGPLKPEDVIPTLSQSYSTIQVVQKSYEKKGLMTQRINEASYSNNILFIDSDIINAYKFTNYDQVISTSSEAKEKLASFIRNSELEDRISTQIKLLPVYEKQLEKLYVYME